MNTRPVWPDDGVILYDGECVLCSRWVRFVAEHDVDRQFRFTTIKSPYGAALAGRLGIDVDDPKTNAVILGGAALTCSDAAIAVISRLSGWGWTASLTLVPKPLRDLAYYAIARSRYRLFGRLETCAIPDAELRQRILE
jgi:predicted DCC family thiol-disulfide oxidoreductase YuxK